jgi:hypothetical protein
MAVGVTAGQLAAGLTSAARQAGQDDPLVRRADWQTAIVTAVNATTGTVDIGSIRARRLDTYLNPAVGDQIAVMQSGNGNWIALGRLSGTADTAWTPYAVQWLGSTTNPAIVNGTLIGLYQRTGRTVVCQINLTAGSSTTFGAGTFTFTLPFTAASQGATYVGEAHFLRSAAIRFGGQFLISPGATAASPAFPASAADCHLVIWASTASISWLPMASGDQMRITITYEAAN